MSNYGIVEYFGCNEDSHRCGYCKQMKSGDTDFGMWGHRLSNSNYQNLIDRNWRRSGQYCYKPVLERTCCPMYTIRCDALHFKLRKSQKRVIKKFNTFMISDDKPTKRSEPHLQTVEAMDDRSDIRPLFDEKQSTEEFKLNVETSKELAIEKVVDDSRATVDVKSCEQTSDYKVMDKKRGKAKFVRIERKLKKIMENEKCNEKTGREIMSERFKNKVIQKDKRKSLEDYLNEFETTLNAKHKLKIKFVSTTTDEYKKTFDESHKLYTKYQIAIHGDTADKCTAKQFKRFLIDSPLENENCQTCEGLPKNLGSFHQQYWLDEKLIAVGVIDILPYCVSSVYLYYDPEYDFLSIGTYSALREIGLVRKLQTFLPELKYYYMGFYIHSCPKMKYKGRFCPSDLLCGETFTWHPIDVCTAKLDVSKYARFDDNPNAIDRDSHLLTDTEIKILHNRTDISLLYYKSICKLSDTEEQQIKEYAKLVGRKCSSKMLLYRQ